MASAQADHTTPLIQVGKRYLTRKGEVTLPVTPASTSLYDFHVELTSGGVAYFVTKNGHFWTNGHKTDEDLVSEFHVYLPGSRGVEEDEYTYPEAPRAARKDDSSKPDLSLIPTVLLNEVAKGFQLGERKYGRDNYKAGLEATRLLAAALRHIYAVLDGEDLDPESGASHLGHAGCCLAMYLETQHLGTLKDNRYRKPEGV